MRTSTVDEHEQSVSDRKVFGVTDKEARTEKHGLWADADPIAPWDFRQEPQQIWTGFHISG